MPTTIFNFTTLSGNDPAGHTTVNALINSIESRFDTLMSGLSTSATNPAGTGTGYVFRWSGSSWVNAQVDVLGLADDAVTAAKLRDDAVTDANRAVTTNHVRDLAITTGKLADGSVTSSKILDGTIVDVDINTAAAIAKTKISGTAITAADTGTVTSTIIADNSIVNEDINTAAAIADTKLATIATGGKVSNSATTATSANTANAIVARDGTNNFSAGTITAALSGNATTATTATTATNIAGGVSTAIPYQTGSGTTSLSAAGNNGQILQLTANIPTWTNVSGLVINTANIANDAIIQDKMADNSVGTNEIINSNVTYAKLGLNTGVPSTAGGGLTLIDTQTWTSSTTYTLPTNAKICYVELIGGAGGGGGGGRKGSETSGNNSFVYGGAGGGGGGLYIGWVKATDLGTPGNNISITIGAGGAGGAGRTSTSGDGNDGVDGGNTSLGSNIVAVGGLRGGKGWWYPNGSPISYFGTTLYNVYFYIPSTTWGTSGGPGVKGYKGYIAGGGGGGGGVLELNSGVVSGEGGGNISEFSVTSAILNLIGGGAAAGSNGTSGGSGATGSAFNGGGGGGYGTGGIGGAGGSGGTGAGGGGGGAAAQANAGSGGAGGNGRIRLWIYG